MRCTPLICGKSRNITIFEGEKGIIPPYPNFNSFTTWHYIVAYTMLSCGSGLAHSFGGIITETLTPPIVHRTSVSHSQLAWCIRSFFVHVTTLAGFASLAWSHLFICIHRCRASPAKASYPFIQSPIPGLGFLADMPCIKGQHQPDIMTRSG